MAGDDEIKVWHEGKESEIALNKAEEEAAKSATIKNNSITEWNKAQTKALNSTNWTMILLGIGSILTGIGTILSVIL